MGAVSKPQLQGGREGGFQTHPYAVRVMRDDPRGAGPCR